MCGICGIFNYGSETPVDLAELSAMNRTLVHRGPDDEGAIAVRNAGLAMRRLSIIDVAGGHQPIANEDGSIVLVMNGEIYNYRQLQREVVDRGHTLRTRSDTETIVHLYEDFGTACVERLDGMFAFALLDSRPRTGGPKLLLARDRVGKKPLYYANVANRLVFGSELKPILATGAVSRQLDVEALHHYLSLRMVPSPLSIFRDIRKIPAGHILECDEDGVRLQRYWSYADTVRKPCEPLHDRPLENIRELLLRAVEKRLIAEVPLGAFLSGGIDSSAVVGLMSRLKQEPVKTFSIGFRGPATHDELPYARRVAQHFGTEHHEYVVEPNVVELIEQLVYYADEPFAISSAIPTFLLAREARRDVTVVLTGDGGDEIFYGYESYLYEQWASLYRTMPPAADSLLRNAVRLLPARVNNRLGRLRSQVEKFTAAARSDPAGRRLGWSASLGEAQKSALYSESFRSATKNVSTPAFLSQKIPDVDFAGAAGVNLLDVDVWLADEMLAKVDRMTMAASVEARCPLLDSALLDYVARIPIARKVPGPRNRNLKHLLREAVREFVPADILDRPKHGFNVPLDHWFRGEIRSYVRSVLSPDRLRRRGIFDATAVTEILDEHEAGRANRASDIYALLVFEVWAAHSLNS